MTRERKGRGATQTKGYATQTKGGDTEEGEGRNTEEGGCDTEEREGRDTEEGACETEERGCDTHRGTGVAWRGGCATDYWRELQ